MLAVTREFLTSGQHATRLGNSDLQSTSQILSAAREGDALAVAVIDKQARVLATIMGICAVTLDVERIILGGGLGIAEADLLLPRVRNLIGRHIPPHLQTPEIVVSTVESSAVGAAAIVFAAART
jgi:predicted NBD/HSP70 family sugar kinase